jgi:membrane associated rhomboid family serine protease
MLGPRGISSLPTVVKNLIIINVLVFLGNWLLFHNRFDDMLALYHPSSPFFRPYQIVTYMFMHGSFWHLFFNMFALWMFGVELEHVWGPRRFLVYYLACGLGAAALHFLLSSVAIIGASGAVFGILLAYGFMFPNRQLMLLFPPIPLKAKYFVIGYGLIELLSGFNGSSDGIAHFAHLGGMAVGLVLLLIWRKQGRLY